MKRIILLCSVALVSLQSIGQELTFKKGSFKYEKEEVATVEDKRFAIIYKNFFVINKAGQEIISFKVEYANNHLGYNEDNWYSVDFPSLGKKAQRNYPLTIFGSAEKEIMPDIADMTIINKDGSLNAEGVEKYLAKYNVDLSKQAQARADSILDLISRGGKFGSLEKGKLKVGFDKSITVDGKQVGTWSKTGKDADSDIWVFNNDGGLECIIRRTKMANEAKVDVLTWDGSKSRHNNDGTFYGVSYGDSDTNIILGVIRKIAYR